MMTLMQSDRFYGYFLQRILTLGERLDKNLAFTAWHIGLNVFCTLPAVPMTEHPACDYLLPTTVHVMQIDS